MVSGAKKPVKNDMKRAPRSGLTPLILVTRIKEELAELMFRCARKFLTL